MITLYVPILGLFMCYSTFKSYKPWNNLWRINVMGIFGNDLFKEMFDANGDGRLDATENFMRDMFVIEELLPEDERRKIKGESYFDKNSDD